MLVLTRQKGQKIIIQLGGEKLVLSVFEIRGDKVKLAFDAPESIHILREELLDQVKKENKSASGLNLTM